MRESGPGGRAGGSSAGATAAESRQREARRRDGGRALVVAAHGSHRNPRSVEPAFAHADRVRERVGVRGGRTGFGGDRTGFDEARADFDGERAGFDEVRAAFWKNEPSLREVVASLESDEVVVVPLFTSEGYFVEEVLSREFGLAADANPTKSISLADPVGTHERVARVLVERAESVTGDPDVGPGVGLAVVGHGTERNANSARATREHAARIRDSGRFDEVRALFMDEPPHVDDLLDHVESRDVVVVPLFVADGYHTTEDIPEDIGLTDDHREGWAVPAEVEGRRVWYAGAVGTEPGLADVILERAAEVEAEDGMERGAVPNRSADPSLDPDGHRRAFLDWLEAGDGSRTWGELAITTTPTNEGGEGRQESGAGRHGDDEGRYEGDEGWQRYALRHRDDRGRPIAALDVSEDPAAARDLARFDDRGGFRPLAGAPTLPTGWALVGLDGPGLLRAVEAVYPASVAAWHREREGDLDVTNFREAAARQTGIYAPVAEAGSVDVTCAADACCADCVRRRAWDEAEDRPADAPQDDPIDAPRGDGEIPCREPCSFFVAALREFQDLDADGGTETDHDGDADPDGDADAAVAAPDPSVRAAAFEDPANPYRVRFLAAKRARSEAAKMARCDGGDA